MNFVTEMFSTGAKAAAGGRARSLVLPTITSSSAPLSYNLSALRWHGDSRPASAVLAVHDWNSTSRSWSGVVRALGQLPTQINNGQLSTVSEPVHMYAVNLPPAQMSSSYTLECAADVAAFRKNVVKDEPKVHLVGIGHGAYVCACVALALQDSITSVTLVLPPQQDVCKTKYELLSSAVAHNNKCFAEVSRTLSKAIPNEWECAMLLQHVTEDVDGTLRILPSLSSTAMRDSQSTPAWVTPNAQHDVAFSGKCTVLHSSSSPVNLEAIKRAFPAAVFRSSDTLCISGDVSQDLDVSQKLLSSMGLLGSMPVPGEEAAE